MKSVVSPENSPQRAGVRIFVAFAVLTSVAGCAKSPASVGEILADRADKHDMPGMALIVTDANRDLHLAVYGVRQVGRSDRIAPTDRFHLGSCTKAITATLIAILIEEGKLRWDSKVGEIFPEWRETMATQLRNVTVTDLLCHRAGLAAYEYEASPESVDGEGLTGTVPEQRREFARRVLQRRPLHPPGTTFGYSNAGYSVAAAIAEQVTNQSWELLLQDRLFAPLHIDAIFDWPANANPAQPWGHFPTDRGPKPHDPHAQYHSSRFLFHSGDNPIPPTEPRYWAREQPFQLPAGGVSISPSDYAKFLRLHLQGLTGHDGLLRAVTVRQLHAKLIEVKEAHGAYGGGWWISEVGGAPASWHGGSAGTFLAMVAIWPSRNLAVAVFANEGGQAAGTACWEVLERTVRAAQLKP